MPNVTIGGHAYDEETVRAAIEGIVDAEDLGRPVDDGEAETVITLPDGQVLRVAGAATLVPVDGGIEIHGPRTAGPPAAAFTQPLPPDGAMQMAGEPEGDEGGDMNARMEACEGAVQDLQAQMQGVLQFIQAVTQGNVASALAALDDEVESHLAAALATLDDADAELHVFIDGNCSTCARLAATSAKKPYGDVEYADPGYQKDGQKRYPIDTRAHVRAAWSYINQGDNAALYSAENLAKVKAAIQRAGKKFGVTFSEKAAA